MLADVQDNPGAGGTSDTVGLLAALMRHKAKGAVIGMIVDEGAAQAAVETGEGNVMRRGIGAVVGYAGETPVEADWRVVKLGDGKFTGTGPFYGGAKFHIGPMALVTDEASGVSAVLASKRIQAADQEMFRHVGVEPSKVPILGAEIDGAFPRRFPADRRDDPVVQSPGAHITDPVEMPYKHLRKGMRLQADGAGVEWKAGLSAHTIGTVSSATRADAGQRGREADRVAENAEQEGAGRAGDRAAGVEDGEGVRAALGLHELGDGAVEHRRGAVQHQADQRQQGERRRQRRAAAAPRISAVVATSVSTTESTTPSRDADPAHRQLARRAAGEQQRQGEADGRQVGAFGAQQEGQEDQEAACARRCRRRG